MRGKFITNLTGEMVYKSFCPDQLPPVPPLTITPGIVRLLVQASRDISVLNTAARYIPNADLFTSMYVRKEALLSSQIEGTQCTLDDILDPEADSSINADVTDVVNYVKAVHAALELSKELPLCNRFIRQIHAVLLQGVRGEEKTPGEFRKSQNWVGPAGCTLKDARYIPPNVEDMTQLMGNLEEFLNENNEYDSLIQAALIHYQFETIHPFLDGNGRVGRLLITLYLMEKGVITSPVLYVSYFLKKNQAEYYDRMSEARFSGNLEQWVRFFLEALDAAAIDALDAANLLAAMHEENLMYLDDGSRRGTKLCEVLSYLESHPIVRVSDIAAAFDISYNTAASYVNNLVEKDILRETTNTNRNRVFAYEAYLEVLRKDT